MLATHVIPPVLRPPQPTDDRTLHAALAGALAGRRAGERLRLFAYGALMWEPEKIPGATARPAMLTGFARAYVLLDVRDRGTPEAPGLTLGLVPRPEARCDGLLYDLPEGPEAEHAALEPAWRQEMTPGFYRADWVEAAPLPEGGACRALTFVADEGHPLWAGGIGEEGVAAVLATARGEGGTALDYLRRANAALRAAGLRDETLLRLEAGTLATV